MNQLPQFSPDCNAEGSYDNNVARLAASVRYLI